MGGVLDLDQLGDEPLDPGAIEVLVRVSVLEVEPPRHLSRKPVHRLQFDSI